MAIHSIEAGTQQGGCGRRVAEGEYGRVLRGHGKRVAVSFRHKEDITIAAPCSGDGPNPEFSRNHVRDIAAEAVDALFLPELDGCIDLPPGIRNGKLKNPGASILPRIGDPDAKSYP